MVVPRHISFADWAMSFYTDFPDSGVVSYSRNSGDKDWKTWGKQMASIPFFSNNHFPAPGEEENWEDWAMKVYLIFYPLT